MLYGKRLNNFFDTVNIIYVLSVFNYFVRKFKYSINLNVNFLKFQISWLHLTTRPTPDPIMSPTPFDWSKIIADLTDETFGIPPDVVFQIVENDQVFAFPIVLPQTFTIVLDLDQGNIA